MFCLGAALHPLGDAYSHYRNEELRRWPHTIGLGPKSRRLSLTRWLFPHAVGLGVIGVIGRRVGLKAVELAFTVGVG
jgi:hypothetical protein